MNIPQSTKLELLNLIHNNKGTILDESYCSLSQQEMGEYLGLPRRTVSRIIGELVSEGYVIPRNGRVRRYALTNRGKGLIRRTNSL